MSDGHTWRGMETMLTKLAKEGMEAVRYAKEGVNNLRGDPILADVGGPKMLMQAVGFNPTELADQQRVNNALMNYQTHIQDRGQSLMNAFAMTQIAGDEESRGDAVAKTRAFNAKYPEIAIRLPSLQASLRTRAQRSAQSENGVILQKKLVARGREEVGRWPANKPG